MKIKSIKKIIYDSPKQFYDVIEANPYNNFLIKTNSSYIVSHNCNFTDEVNFGAMTSDVEKIKSKQKHLISQVDARMQSRFMKGNKLPTLNIIASSKSSDQSFLDSYIEMKKKNESKTTLVIDEPQWVIRTDKDSPIKFYVAVGDKFKASEILPIDASEELVSSYRDKGYNMLQVPSGYYETFKDNVELALTDIAGISTTSALKYISGVRLKEIKTADYLNPFSRDVIEVGTNDDFQYGDFFDLKRVKERDKSLPLYVHLDMSTGSGGKGDKTGIAGVWISGKVGDEAHFKTAFSVSIKAPKGYEISFEKNKKFIRWLRAQGFKVKGVSSDTFQSAQIHQQLTADKFDVKTISVDKLDNVSVTKQKVCLPYAFLKNAIYEKKLTLYDKCDLLTDEIVNLEREADGHINHPENGTQGCFTGDTKVRLVDGRSLSFLDLIDEFNQGKINYVYSFNESTQRIEVKPIINAWCTKKNAKIMKVVLDNGEEIRCTLNHRFMMRDGTYKEAKDLKPMDSMMPLYTKLNDKGLIGYRLFYEPMENEWHFEHRRFASQIDDAKYLVHHKNCNKLDNSPTNLIWCSKERHYQIHLELQVGCHSKEAREKKSEKMLLYHQNKDEKYLERNNLIKNKMLERSKGTQAYKSREEIPKINELFNIDFESLSPEDKLRYRKSYHRSLQENSIIDLKKEYDLKIAYIEFLEDLADVYDITVQDNHNFALDAGVFVHNSKDQVDALCGALWNASQNIDQFSFDYGEDLTTIQNVSAGGGLDYAQKQLTEDFQSELEKMFNPAAYQRIQEENKVDKTQPYMDFGLGAAKPVVSKSTQYAAQGIIVPWW